MSKNTYEMIRTTCPLDCPDSCGLIACVSKGRIVSLKGDPDHPYSRGVICRKMRNYPERFYSQQRISHPLIRQGKKGDGKFGRITWDEAYDILVRRIVDVRTRYGGEAILPFAYAGNMGAVNRFAGYPLFHKLETTRQLETICSAAAGAGWKSHCGDIPGSPPEKAEDADLIVIWGANTRVTNMHFWPYVTRAKKKGARLVVIDPYRTDTAARADLHLPVTPGGDGALALALLKNLHENDGLDQNFIAECTSGFSDLIRYLETVDFGELVRLSQVERGKLLAFAHMLGSSKRVFFRLGIGMTRNSRAGMSIRSITSLAAALGLFDGGAGRGVLLTSKAFSGDTSVLTFPNLAGRPTRVVNMVQLGLNLKAQSPPVHLLFVYNANPLAVVPDGSCARNELLREDLFTVVHEQVMTPTARYADLILPATTFLENMDVNTAYGQFYITVSRPVVAPFGEAKSNFVFFQELAERLGFDDLPFQQTIEERIESYLKTIDGLPEQTTISDCLDRPVRSNRHNCSLAQFSTKNPYCFSQSELVPQTARAVPAGEFDDPDLQARFPFKLITPPQKDLLNSTFGERYPNHLGEVLVHPVDARQYSIKSGMIVILENNRGRSRRVAHVSEDTQQGLLVAEGVFWQKDSKYGGINDLTSQKLTDLGEGATFHESRVRLCVS